MSETKQCSRCKKHLPLDKFDRHESGECFCLCSTCRVSQKRRSQFRQSLSVFASVDDVIETKQLYLVAAACDKWLRKRGLVMTWDEMIARQYATAKP